MMRHHWCNWTTGREKSGNARGKFKHHKPKTTTDDTAEQIVVAVNVSAEIKGPVEKPAEAEIAQFVPVFTGGDGYREI